MQGCNLQVRLLSAGRRVPLAFTDSSPYVDIRSRAASSPVRYGCNSRFKLSHAVVKAHASNAGAGSYDGAGETPTNKDLVNDSSKGASSDPMKLSGVRYPLSIAGVLLGCALVFSLIAFWKEGPSAVVASLAKSGFTAAFTLILVSEIGDKTFFIAALLAMQYDKLLVLLGSMGALSLMTIFSVVIGRIFQSVPAQFQTTLPIGEYAAVALLTFFGFTSIKNAWNLPSNKSKNSEDNAELGELVEAEELVKEKVDKKLTNPLEIIWKSFSLVFFAEWGDRSMLATIAFGAAPFPWGVASGAIGGDLFATCIAILGGSFLANYVSEELCFSSMAARIRGASNEDQPYPSIQMCSFKIGNDFTDPFL